MSMQTGNIVTLTIKGKRRRAVIYEITLVHVFSTERVPFLWWTRPTVVKRTKEHFFRLVGGSSND